MVLRIKITPLLLPVWSAPALLSALCHLLLSPQSQHIPLCGMCLSLRISFSERLEEVELRCYRLLKHGLSALEITTLQFYIYLCDYLLNICVYPC